MWDSVRSNVPARHLESETPFKAGTNDGHGKLDGSRLIDFAEEALSDGAIGIVRW